MKVLVIGGSRFVGLHLVGELGRQGHEVSVLNRGQTAVQFPEGVKRLLCDRHDSDAVRSTLSGSDFDAVFDTSAYTPDELGVMLSALEDRVGHYIFCSTTAVYTNSETAPIREDFPLFRQARAGSYGGNKILCEDLLRTAREEKGLPFTVIRPSMVYGPDNYILQREFSFFARLMRGRPIFVPGDGAALLHFGHVDDLARAFAAVPGKSQANGEAYTVTGPDAISVNGYVATLAGIVGVEPEVRRLGADEVGRLERPVFPYEWRRSTIHSIEKARQQLKWEPEYDFAAGHRQTFEWFRERTGDYDFDFAYEDELLQRYGKAVAE